MALQPAKNYINWVVRSEVVTTLVVEEWCKGTPLDTTSLPEALYNNLNDGGKVEGLVVSFYVVEINIYVIFEILMVV